MRAPTQENLAFVLGLGAVLCWSTVATAFKLALADISLLQLLAVATTVSLLFLTGLLGVRGELGSAVRGFRHQWRRALGLGLLNPGLYYLILFAAYARLPAQVAQPVNYTWAIVLALMAAVFLRQPLNKRDIWAMILGYGGVVIICLGGGGENNAVSLSGLFLAVLSTLLWAGYWILNSMDDRPPVIALFQNFLAAFPLIILAVVGSEGPAALLPNPGTGLAAAVWVGLFEMGVSFVCWLYAMKLTQNTSRISNLIFLSPFLSLVFIHFLLGETIQQETFAGLVIIILALWIQNRGRAGVQT